MPYRLRMSPDGRRFLYFHDDTRRELAVGDLDSKETNPVLQLANRGPSCFSPDGKLIASVEQDSNHLEILDAESLKVLHFVGKLPSAVAGIRWSPHGLLAAGCSDRVCRIWNTQTWQLIHELTGHSSLPEAIDFSKDGRTLAVGDRAGSLRLWDPRYWAGTAGLHTSDIRISRCLFHRTRQVTRLRLISGIESTYYSNGIRSLMESIYVQSGTTGQPFFDREPCGDFKRTQH